MLRLIKAFFFKIVRDLTFRITLIIGVALALISTLGLYFVYLAIGQGDADAEMVKSMINGQSMLINSLSPAQNFGIAIPVNLICFVALEFNHGTIRNKIIAGNSKLNIYFSLLISGLFFAFALLLVYVGLCTGISSILGGFDAHGVGSTLLGSSAYYTPSYILRMVALGLLTYVSIVSFTIFIVTTFRSIGPSIPVIILLIYVCYIAATLVSTFDSLAQALEGMNGAAVESIDPEAAAEASNQQEVLTRIVWIGRIVDPLYGISSSEIKMINEFEAEHIVSDETFFSGIISNLVYTAIFAGFGAFEFSKRDVK